MKKISSHTFKYTLRDIKSNTENRKFCFILGAGSSFSSGIPTGGKLAEKWFSEIKDIYPEGEIEQWLREGNIDESDLASNYGPIYRKRFENDKTSGYEFLVQAMRTAKPTFGHIVLAQILSKSSGHVVLTTNFDSLIESSIYQFTDNTPLVCGHESLSGYARPSQIHPLIIKIHRDLLLAPKSDPAEISELDKGWKEPLDNIFSSHIPIVIGYGGNDGSLMTYFEKMNKPSNFFWCGLNESDLSSRVKTLIEQMDGSFVQIDGFDEIMHELLWVFDEIKPIDEELEEITKLRIETADKQLAKITKTNTATVDENRKTHKELSAFEYAELAQGEPNYEKRKGIYLEALDKFPNTAWLWNEFTHFLHSTKKDYEGLDSYYLKALETAPNNVISNGNYALFLKDIKKDYQKADIFFLKALSIEPNAADFNGNYAQFLKDIKKDYQKADIFFLKALSIKSDDANNNSNYAVFLKDIKKDYVKAENYLLKALSIQSENANFNGNYAMVLFLIDKRVKAISYLDKAFHLNQGKRNEVLLELWFYRYAHCLEIIEKSEKEIETLLNEGIRSEFWNLKANVDKAIKDGHPNPEKLKEFAFRISGIKY